MGSDGLYDMQPKSTGAVNSMNWVSFFIGASNKSPSIWGLYQGPLIFGNLHIAPLSKGSKATKLRDLQVSVFGTVTLVFVDTFYFDSQCY